MVNHRIAALLVPGFGKFKLRRLNKKDPSLPGYPAGLKGSLVQLVLKDLYLISFTK